MEDEKYRRAKRRVKDLKGFYTHLAIFILINVILAILNLFTSPGTLWFYWITIFWGIFLLWHAFVTFVRRGIFSDEWEERKIKEIMERDKK